MNLKIGSVIINDLRILRLQGFKARKLCFRGILSPLLRRGERGLLGGVLSARFVDLVWKVIKSFIAQKSRGRSARVSSGIPGA
jgi:hypothetical protein